MTCGYRSGPLSACEALTVLLDLPAAYHAAFDAPADDVCTRADAEGWTAIEYTAHVAEVLHATRKRLVLLFEDDDRDVSPACLEGVRASARGAQPEVVLASLSAACCDLARLVGTVPDEVWERKACRDGAIVTARDLLADALHEAHHHARDAHAASGCSTARPLLLAPA
jgi:hypothetical protein